MSKFLVSVCFVVLTILLLSCRNEPRGILTNATIKIHAFPENLSEVNVAITTTFNDINIISKTTLDSNGTGLLLFPLQAPTFAQLKINSFEYTIYVGPGYDLEINESEEGSIIYTGNGADINNYLSGISKLQKEIENRNGKNIAELTSSQFRSRLDSLVSAFDNFHNHFVDSMQMQANLVTLLLLRNKMRILLLRQAFQWNYGARHDFDIPDEINMAKEIPYDSVLLNSGMLEYMLMMHMNINMIAKTLLRNTTTIEESKEAALRINKEIQNERYSQYFKSFMLAKNIDYWMNQFGANYPIDTLYLKYKSQYPCSQFLGMIENRYNKLSDLLPGSDAPLIGGTTPEGDNVSTDDFKGKIIYIDVWASWCGPCINEVPFAIELQNTFTSIDPIIFLNVSVDQDTTDWRTALLDHVNWKGIHIYGDPSIYRTFNIAGIPRYIIIDENGKIVSTDALRPSTKELRTQLMELTRKVERQLSE